MKVAVAGATGRLGRHVSEVLVERGHVVVSMSRATGVDVITGAGLDEALAGVDAIVDAATGPSPEQQAATEFFLAAAGNLQAAGARAGVRRAVVVSIVGTDRFVGGYGVAKVAHEQAWLSGPVPALVVRSAQFHEFVAQLLDWGTDGELATVPAMRTQIVAARAVAEVIAELITGEAGSDWTGGAGPVEVAGPREERLLALASMLAERRGAPGKVEEAVPDPGDQDAQMQASGGLLPGPTARLVGPTFTEWLEQE